MTPALEVALAARQRTPREPFTIRRLREIKPGQEVIYYSGDVSHFSRPEPASYQELMERIAALARDLESAGRVELQERKRPVKARDGTTVTITDYIAVGRVCET